MVQHVLMFEVSIHCTSLVIMVLTVSFFIGVGFQTLILRDWWLCTVLSIMFEVLEYTLEHQLPNFSECWWDHVSGHLAFGCFLFFSNVT